MFVNFQAVYILCFIDSCIMTSYLEQLLEVFDEIPQKISKEIRELRELDEVDRR